VSPSVPERCKRYFVNGLRETFGLIGVRSRLSLGRQEPIRAKEAEEMAGQARP
jgi:hypothetical protein